LAPLPEDEALPELAPLPEDEALPELAPLPEDEALPEMEAPPTEMAPPPPPPAEVPQQDWVAGSAELPSTGAVSGSMAWAPPVPDDSGGGLAKRVPGASLSESPLGDATTTSVPDQDRSADGVRSMLSSFQSGRHRGLDGAVAVADPETGDAHQIDARGAMETTDAEPASELEDPRDH